MLTTSSLTGAPVSPVQSPWTSPPLDSASLPPRSRALGSELDRLEATKRQERDRAKQEELARLRDLARYD